MTIQYASESKVVVSKDGIEIYADAVGDPTKPALVFIHGFSLSSIVFDSIFADHLWTDYVYLVGRLQYWCAQLVDLTNSGSRCDTMYAVMVEVVNQRTRRPGNRSDWQMTSMLSWKGSN